MRLYKRSEFLIVETLSKFKDYAKKNSIELNTNVISRVRALFDKNPNNIFTALYLVLNADKTGFDLDKLAELERIISSLNKNTMKMLPKPFFDYKELEELSDDYTKLQDKIKYNTFYNNLYASMRSEVDSLSDRDKEKFYNIAVAFMNLDENIRSSFTPLKYFMVNKKDIKYLMSSLQKFVNKEDGDFKEAILTKIKNYQDELEIVYYQDDILIIRLVNPTYEMVEDLGSIKWCIAYSKYHYNEYITNELGQQYIIYDFNLPKTNPLHIIGVTVKLDGTYASGACQDGANYSVISYVNTLLSSINIKLRNLYGTMIESALAELISLASSESFDMYSITEIYDILVRSGIINKQKEIPIAVINKKLSPVIIQILSKVKFIDDRLDEKMITIFDIIIDTIPNSICFQLFNNGLRFNNDKLIKPISNELKNNFILKITDYLKERMLKSYIGITIPKGKIVEYFTELRNYIRGDNSIGLHINPEKFIYLVKEYLIQNGMYNKPSDIYSGLFFNKELSKAFKVYSGYDDNYKISIFKKLESIAYSNGELYSGHFLLLTIAYNMEDMLIDIIDNLLNLRSVQIDTIVKDLLTMSSRELLDKISEDKYFTEFIQNNKINIIEALNIFKKIIVSLLLDSDSSLGSSMYENGIELLKLLINSGVSNIEISDSDQLTQIIKDVIKSENNNGYYSLLSSIADSNELQKAIVNIAELVLVDSEYISELSNNKEVKSTIESIIELHYTNKININDMEIGKLIRCILSLYKYKNKEEKITENVIKSDLGYTEFKYNDKIYNLYKMSIEKFNKLFKDGDDYSLVDYTDGDTDYNWSVKDIVNYNFSTESYMLLGYILYDAGFNIDVDFLYKYDKENNPNAIPIKEVDNKDVSYKKIVTIVDALAESDENFGDFMLELGLDEEDEYYADNASDIFTDYENAQDIFDNINSDNFYDPIRWSYDSAANDSIYNQIWKSAMSNASTFLIDIPDYVDKDSNTTNYFYDGEYIYLNLDIKLLINYMYDSFLDYYHENGDSVNGHDLIIFYLYENEISICNKAYFREDVNDDDIYYHIADHVGIEKNGKYINAIRTKYNLPIEPQPLSEYSKYILEKSNILKYKKFITLK